MMVAEATSLHGIRSVGGIPQPTGERPAGLQGATCAPHAVWCPQYALAMSSAIDALDPSNGGHSERVARLAAGLAHELDWTPEAIARIHLAGLLHDIGKIGIDRQLLRKPEPLTGPEYEQVKQHPVLGYRILSGVQPMAGILPAVLYHHEQWNGGGYPEGLAGEQIPQIARIVAVADAFDAMTSDRPYRDGLPLDMVRQVFQEGAGTLWDPAVVAACFRSLAQG